MKAAMNGVPNCSILDGWWPEDCEHGVNGWAIGEAEDERDDVRDAENIYSVLEQEVLRFGTRAGALGETDASDIATSARFTARG